MPEADTVGFEKNPQKDIVAVGVLWIYYIVLMVLGFYSLTAGQGLRDSSDLLIYLLFSIPMVAYAGFVTVLAILRNTGHLTNIVMFLHDTEISIFGRFRIISNPLYFVLLSVGFFTLMGFIGSVSESTVGAAIFPWAVGAAPETTTSARILFDVYNAPAENAWLYITLGLIVTAELYFLSKLGASKKIIYWGLLPINALLAGFLWLKIHALVTQSATAGLKHFIFGVINALVTLGTGSIIPTETYHIFNNFFQSIKTVFSSQIVTVIFGISLLVIVLIFVGVFFLKKKVKGEGRP